MLSTSHPAKAIYDNASAHSDALNCVSRPYFLATASKSASCSEVAPEIASTFDIDASKVSPVSIASAVKLFISSVAFCKRSKARFPINSPTATVAELNPSSASFAESPKSSTLLEACFASSEVSAKVLSNLSAFFSAS